MPHTPETLADLRRRFAAVRSITALSAIRKETPDHCLLAFEIDQAVARECEQQLGLVQARTDLVRIYEAAPKGSSVHRTAFHALVAHDEKAIREEGDLIRMRSYMDWPYLEPSLKENLDLRISMLSAQKVAGR